ncbi:DUF1572 family protein [Maribacter aestuarii]|uniref:DUF1572 family protein n=1 Tax=Maribacter aestuarii TaxID=1130723 RepID=UPI00248C5C10|nr:DUF1572 family protein [Maribacter aestuarii]
MLDLENYIQSVRLEFERYKTLGDKTFQQLSDEELLWKYSSTDNSIAQIVKHMAGNMLSRWTNFLTEDGEKPWRQRENEFSEPSTKKSEIITSWEQGWDCLFNALNQIDSKNFNTEIKIRNESHTIVEALNRQLAHYPNHVGQIVLLGKMIKGGEWRSLSIPKGESEAFNRMKFGGKE